MNILSARKTEYGEELAVTHGSLRFYINVRDPKNPNLPTITVDVSEIDPEGITHRLFLWRQ